MPKTKITKASKQTERIIALYKFCFVPKCNSTTSRTPLKTFFRVPRDFKERKKWFEAAGLEEDEIRVTSLRRRIDLWICEDHFDPGKDVIMFPSRKRMGYVKVIKPGAVPHRFECQRETAEDPSLLDTSEPKQSAPPNLGDRRREEVEDRPPAVENATKESEQRVSFKRLKEEPPEEEAEPLVPRSIDRENPTDPKIIHREETDKVRGQFISSDDSDSSGQQTSPAKPQALFSLCKQQTVQRTKTSSTRTAESTQCSRPNSCKPRADGIGCLTLHTLPWEIAKSQSTRDTLSGAIFSNRGRSDDSDDDERQVDNRANVDDDSSDDDSSEDDNEKAKTIFAPSGSDTEESIEGGFVDYSDKIDEKHKKLRALKSKIYGDATELLIEEDPFSFVGILKDDLSMVDNLSQATGISKKDIHLIMVKLRLNLPNAVLAAYFGIAEYAILPRMQIYLPMIAMFLNNRIKVAKIEETRLILPAAFSALAGPLHSIIHIFTLHVDKPIVPVTKTDENHCRRYLISVTPDGIINYLSNGFSGQSNDVEIIGGSEYLEALPSKVAVLADHHYEAVRSILNGKNCTLLRPPIYLVDLNSSEEISIFVRSAEMYVEKIIDRLKEFQFIDHFRSSRDNLDDLDHALIIAAALVNFQTINAM